MIRQPTTRELDILREYVRTSSVKEAATRLGITPQAAKNRLGRLYEALEVSGAFEATIALGWMRVPEGPARCGIVGRCPLAIGHKGAHIAAERVA